MSTSCVTATGQFTKPFCIKQHIPTNQIHAFHSRFPMQSELCSMVLLLTDQFNRLTAPSSLPGVRQGQYLGSSFTQLTLPYFNRGQKDPLSDYKVTLHSRFPLMTAVSTCDREDHLGIVTATAEETYEETTLSSRRHPLPERFTEKLSPLLLGKHLLLLFFFSIIHPVYLILRFI